MREDLLLKRKMSYLINEWDDINLPYETNFEDIPSQVVDFFFNESQLIYPAKSYFVAIVYASCMKDFFEEEFYRALSDKELLPDDKFFKTYTEDKETYDAILEKIKNPLAYDASLKTINYFKKEFLIGTDN